MPHIRLWLDEEEDKIVSMHKVLNRLSSKEDAIKDILIQWESKNDYPRKKRKKLRSEGR